MFTLKQILLFAPILGVLMDCPENPKTEDSLPYPQLEKNCIGYWDFDKTEGGRISDLSGMGHDAVIHGSPLLVCGVSGNALQFQSNHDYIDFRKAIIPEHDFSISVWIKCFNTEKQFFLGQYLYKHPNRLDFAIREGCVRIQLGKIVDTESIIEKNRWYHIVYTRINSILKIYVNGKLIKKERMEEKVLQSETLIAGKIFVPGRTSYRFTGQMDELRIYASALSLKKIKKLHISHNKLKNKK